MTSPVSKVWDVKFPNAIIPHSAMRDEDVLRDANTTVARVLSWSMDQSLAGIGPSKDMDNEDFNQAFQLSLRGQPLAAGWRLVYFGWKSDLKARVQAHFFSRYYLCNNICDSCFATRPHANRVLSFTHLGEEAACWMTEVRHEDYLRHDPSPSPWTAMPGFRLETVFFDAMHIIWLGSARVLLASCLGAWHKLGVLGVEPLSVKLRAFSFEMKRRCRENQSLGFAVMFVVFVRLLCLVRFGQTYMPRQQNKVLPSCIL